MLFIIKKDMARDKWIVFVWLSQFQWTKVKGGNVVTTLLGFSGIDQKHSFQTFVNVGHAYLQHV